MKNLLYIGNNLSTRKTNVSSVKTLGRLLETEGYQLRYASSYKNKGFRLLHMLWACFKNRKWADAVIIDTYSTQNFYYALACSQLCRLLKVPYYTSLNGGNLPQRLTHSPKYSALIFNHAKKNITPSLYLKEAFEAKGFFNITYIPNTIEVKNYPYALKRFETIRLLWVRSFSEIYNPEMAIKVQKALGDLGYTTSLCMIGPDSDGSLKSLKALARQFKTNTEFTGKLSKQDWISKSKAYNIFINTTNFDNAPVSVIEAMALGFPIISTNAGGMPFLIEDGEQGLLCDKADVNAMVAHIVNVFSDSELANRLSISARKKAETFDWATVKLLWISIIG